MKAEKFQDIDGKKAALRVTILTLLLFITLSCNGQTKQGKATENKEIKYKVTFVELGSVRCIPCQQMQSVMKSIEKKYGDQVKIIFHDVWTETGAPFGKQYSIEAIPTQVFLDDKGKEYFRHVGYFPEAELVEVLKQKGVK